MFPKTKNKTESIEEKQMSVQNSTPTFPTNVSSISHSKNLFEKCLKYKPNFRFTKCHRYKSNALVRDVMRGTAGDNY